MIVLRKITIYSLFFLLLVSSIVGLVHSITFNINVKSNSEASHEFDLILEDHVLLQVRSIGSTSGNFSSILLLPNDSTIQIGEGNSFDYSFICEIEGHYILKFINSDIQNDKLVTLNVEIQNYVFGMPKMLFMTLLIVGICLVGVVFFVFLGKTYHY
jgi:hypothetical protein